jgi:hypothetical protein
MWTSAAALSEDDLADLVRLEEGMWREETRFDMTFMEKHLSDDFFEFGRSGRTYARAQTLAVPRQATDAVLPLPNLKVRLLGADVAQVTYDSAVTYDGVVEHAHRSSIWSRSGRTWLMRFHQGTPYEP